MRKDDEIFDIWGGPNCPIDATLNLIGRKWVIAIIRDMYVGKKHFNEFKANKNNLSNAVLSETLKFMEENGLIEKIVYDNKTRSNTEYFLTQKGKKLNVIIYDLVLYGLDVLDCNYEKIDDYQNKMKKGYKELLGFD